MEIILLDIIQMLCLLSKLESRHLVMCLSTVLIHRRKEKNESTDAVTPNGIQHLMIITQSLIISIQAETF